MGGRLTPRGHASRRSRCPKSPARSASTTHSRTASPARRRSRRSPARASSRSTAEGLRRHESQRRLGLARNARAGVAPPGPARQRTKPLRASAMWPASKKRPARSPPTGSCPSHDPRVYRASRTVSIVALQARSGPIDSRASSRLAQGRPMTDAEIKQAMRAIAAVNGLPLTDERIERDFATYKSYLTALDNIKTRRSADGRRAACRSSRSSARRGADDGTLETRVSRRLDRRRVRRRRPRRAQHTPRGCRPRPSRRLALPQSIADAAALLRTRRLSPVALTQAVLDRIDRVEPRVHAFITVTRDEAHARGARGRTGDRGRQISRAAARHSVRRQGHALHEGDPDDRQHAGAVRLRSRFRCHGRGALEERRAAC